jgi:flagellar biosynthesis protein FlhB
MSEGADESSKTEEPTDKKLSKAREEGQWPISQEIGNGLAVMAILIVFAVILPRMMRDMEGRLSYYLEHVLELPTDKGSIGLVMLRAVNDLMSALWMPILLLLAAGVAGTLAQKGWSPAWSLLVPKFSKISPLSGFQRVFSPVQQAMELAKSLAKLAVVGGLGFLVLLPMLQSLGHYVGIELVPMLEELDRIAFRLLVGIVTVVAIIAAADYLYQRYRYNKNMRMTKQEVKDEYKQNEGDPQVKARIRQLRIERVRKRMMAAVPKADVVVTNPTHYAVALKYDAETMNAPTVTAKGVDSLALRIRTVARENNVPVLINPPLARALYASVDIDGEVPSEHYRAVAEVITYVMKLRKADGR